MSKLQDPMSVLLDALPGLALAENGGDVKDYLIAAWRKLYLTELPFTEDGEVDTAAVEKLTGSSGGYGAHMFTVRLTWVSSYGDTHSEEVGVRADSGKQAARLAWQNVCCGWCLTEPDPHATATVNDVSYSCEPVGSCYVSEVP